MATEMETLKADLRAIVLWDRLYMENPDPDSTDKDAYRAGIFRRVQLFAELRQIAAKN